MEKLLEFLVTEITGERPIKIESQTQSGMTIFVLTVPKEHIPILIGRGGRIINSIRTIASVLATKENIRVGIEVKELE